MIPEDVDLNLEKSIAIFEIYNNIIIPFNIKYKVNKFIRRAVYIIRIIIISSKTYITVSIEGYCGKKLKLPINKDLFFKP